MCGCFTGPASRDGQSCVGSEKTSAVSTHTQQKPRKTVTYVEQLQILQKPKDSFYNRPSIVTCFTTVALAQNFWNNFVSTFISAGESNNANLYTRVALFLGTASITLTCSCLQWLSLLKISEKLLSEKLCDIFIPNFHQASHRHQYQLYVPCCKSCTRFNSCPYRVFSIWKDLSPNETDYSLFASFKSSQMPKHLLWHRKVYFM